MDSYPPRPASADDDSDDRRSAKNLPWQKIFHKRIAPICLCVVEDKEKMDDGTFFAKYNVASGSLQISGESVSVAVVRDARKPPMDLEYNKLTLAIEDPKADFNSPRVASDGIYLVREIAAFPLAPNKQCVNERLFMDRKRENYKAKGWGTGRWRIWLALEDADAQRKKRKKAEIAQNASVARGQAEYDPGTPPSEILKRTSSLHVDISNNSKRFKDTYDIGPNALLAPQVVFRPTMTGQTMLHPGFMHVASPSPLQSATTMQQMQAHQQMQVQQQQQLQQQHMLQQQQQQVQQQQQQQQYMMNQPAVMMMMMPNLQQRTAQPAAQPMQMPTLAVQTPARNGTWIMPSMISPPQPQTQQQQSQQQQQQQPQFVMPSMGMSAMTWANPSAMMFPAHQQTRLM